MKKQLLNIALLLATAGVVNAQVSFAPAVNYGGGINSWGVFSADFNGDGNMDLVTANVYANNLSVRLGNGTGTFATAVNYAVGTNPSSIFSADFNGDGKMDLAATNSGDNTVSILLGSSTGTFAAAVNYFVGAGPMSVFSADYNGDSKMDLATASQSGNNVSVLLGNGDGTFAAHVDYAVGTNPSSIFSADFNGDGKKDLATANFGSNNVSVLLGSGTGTFAAAVNYAVGTNAQSVFSSDFNGDGKKDLAVTNLGSNNVSILLGSGTGTFGAAVSYAVGTNPISVFSADFNGDGKPDLATANQSVNNVSVLLNSGTGTFAAAVNYPVANTPMSIFSADFNNDGRADLVTANDSYSSSVLLNNTPAASLNFDGTDDYVQLPDASINNLNAATIETWVYLYNNSTTQTICSKQHNFVGSYAILTVGMAGTGKVQFNASNSAPTFVSSATLNAGQWYHLAMVFSSTQAQLYINGVLDNTMAGNFSIPNDLSASSAGGTAIGAWLGDGGGKYLNGIVDEFRIWNRALCKGEILNNKNKELSSTQTGLVAYYKFNQGGAAANNSTVTTLTDISGNANTGALNNFALSSTTSNWVAPGAVTSGSTALTYTPVSVSVSSQTNVLCNGGSNGSAAITTAGGTSPYTYLASTGATVSTLSSLTAGVYTYTVTDANACKAIQTLTITQPSALATSTTVSNVLCNGGNTGSATITTIGGTSPYNYLASNGSTLSAQPSLIAGTYNYTVTDNNGCVKTQALTITEPDILGTGTVIKPIFCNGANDGQLTVVGIQGTAPYTYSWSTGATTSTITNLSPGVYTATVTDANGCMASQTKTITEPPPVSVTITASSPSICAGSSSTLTASTSGGMGSTYTYSWVAGPTTSVSVVSPTTTSVYTVNVADDNSCVKSSTISIVANVCSPAEALSFDGANDRVDIGVSLNSILNSSNKITVEAWVNPSTNAGLGCIVGNYNTNIGDMQFLLRRDGSTFGFYVDNGGGYTSVISAATATIGVWQHVAASWDGTVLKIYVNGVLSNTKPLTGSNIRNTINPIWIGANQIGENFNGSIDEVRIWNRTLCQPEIANNMNGEIATTLPNLIGNFHFNQGIAAATNTTVTNLTDASASALTGTLTNIALTGPTSNWIAPGGVTSGNLVTAFASPTIAIIGTTAICNGASTTFTASGNVSTYTWTPGPPTVTITVNPNVTTTYSVVGTATNGCVSNIATKTLTVNSLPTVTVNNGAICAGQSFTMVPTGATTYTYSNGTDVVTPTVNDSYTVSGTDANGCSNTAISNVTVNALPVITSNNGNVHACGDVPAIFGVSSPGTNTYQWYYNNILGTDSAAINGNYTEINFTTDTMTIQQLITGEYNGYYVYCAVTDANGCIALSTNDTIWVNEIPIIEVNSGTICSGNSFSISPSGASTYSYTSGSNIVSPTTNSSYTVTGTDANGCSNTAVSSITVNALPNLTVVTNNTLLCTGQTATLSVSGATTYTWSTLENTADIAVTPSVQTTYTVDGTDVNGCMNTTTITQDVSLCTGIATLSNDASIKVYPNPNNGLFVAELTTPAKVIVTNALGEVVIAETFEAGKHTVNINNETPGVYFVKVMTNNGHQTIKVIKE